MLRLATILMREITACGSTPDGAVTALAPHPTNADVLYRFKINEIVQKLVAKHATTVTPAQISAYYQSHLSQFGTQETRNMRIVLTKTAAEANAAKAALAGGATWKATAAQVIGTQVFACVAQK